MKTLNNKLFKVIELLRFPLALAVVYLHCGGTVDTAPYRDGLNTNFSDLLCITVSHVITHVAVPSFFLISGYLYFKEGKINYSLYHAKIQKRFYTLFLPYILWNFIPFLFVLFKRIGGGILNGTWENVILFELDRICTLVLGYRTFKFNFTKSPWYFYSTKRSN